MQAGFWDHYARWYDRLSILASYVDLQEQVIAELHDLPPTARILDAACGTGYLLMKHVERFPLGEVIGVERSLPMARRARKKLSRYRRKQGGGFNAKLYELDLNLPLNSDAGWHDGYFDAVTSVNTLYALDDPKVFLRECARLLVPGGRLVVANPWVPEPERVLIDHVQQMLFVGGPRMFAEFLLYAPEITALYAANTLIARKAKERKVHFLEPHELADLIEEAGFRVETQKDLVYADTCCLVSATRNA